MKRKRHDELLTLDNIHEPVDHLIKNELTNDSAKNSQGRDQMAGQRSRNKTKNTKSAKRYEDRDVSSGLLN